MALARLVHALTDPSMLHLGNDTKQRPMLPVWNSHACTSSLLSVAQNYTVAYGDTYQKVTKVQDKN